MSISKVWIRLQDLPHVPNTLACPVVPVVKNSPANPGDTEPWVWSLGWEALSSRKWRPTTIFLPGKSMERSLVGYSPWGWHRVKHAWVHMHTHTHTHTHQIHTHTHTKYTHTHTHTHTHTPNIFSTGAPPWFLEVSVSFPSTLIRKWMKTSNSRLCIR